MSSPADQPPISTKSSFQARALLLGERIDIRALGDADRLATSPLVIAVPGGGAAVLFRYGAAVLFDVDRQRQEALLETIGPLVSQPYAAPETETVEVAIDPEGREGMQGNTVRLADFAVERLQVVADVLSKSIVLALYESRIARDFDRIEPFALNLERRSRGARTAGELLSFIGATLLSEQKMIGRAEVTDKPEVIWERPDLERLYLRLAEEFEIRDRYTALDQKLGLVSRTAHTALELLHNRRSLRVEWYIVILIVVEIALSVYDVLIRVH